LHPRVPLPCRVEQASISPVSRVRRIRLAGIIGMAGPIATMGIATMGIGTMGIAGMGRAIMVAHALTEPASITGLNAIGAEGWS